MCWWLKLKCWALNQTMKKHTVMLQGCDTDFKDRVPTSLPRKPEGQSHTTATMCGSLGFWCLLYWAAFYTWASQCCLQNGEMGHDGTFESNDQDVFSAIGRLPQCAGYAVTMSTLMAFYGRGAKCWVFLFLWNAKCSAHTCARMCTPHPPTQCRIWLQLMKKPNPGFPLPFNNCLTWDTFQTPL